MNVVATSTQNSDNNELLLLLSGSLQVLKNGIFHYSENFFNVCAGEAVHHESKSDAQTAAPGTHRHGHKGVGRRRPHQQRQECGQRAPG